MQEAGCGCWDKSIVTKRYLSNIKVRTCAYALF